MAMPERATAEEGNERAISALLKRFATIPGMEARFREEKHIALLQAPIVSEGTLRFMPPGTLYRQVSAPTQSTMLIEGDRFRFHDGQRVQSFDLESNPIVRQFVSSFVYILAGNEAAIRRLYDIRLDSSEDDVWELLLTPRSEAMRRVLREVRIDGRGIVVHRMHLFEASGDETIMTFQEVDTDRAFTEAERSSLFRLPSP